MIATHGGTIPLFITSGACVLAIIFNPIIYSRLKGTSACGMAMIFSTLIVCAIMIFCVDAIGYYMIAMAAIVVSMAYMNVKITLTCGISMMLGF